MSAGSILLVEHDSQERRRIGELLERNGFEVLACPGPSHPDYVCVGGRGLPCPLVQEAAAVVLDMWLGSDVVMRGTPAWELLIYYMEHGKQIVALSAPDDSVNPLSDGRVIAIQRPPRDVELMEAIRAAVIRASDKDHPSAHH